MSSVLYQIEEKKNFQANAFIFVQCTLIFVKFNK